MIDDQRAFLKNLGFEKRDACSAAKNNAMQISGESKPEIGVYAFVVGNQVYYVGSARRGLKERPRPEREIETLDYPLRHQIQIHVRACARNGSGGAGEWEDGRSVYVDTSSA